MVLYPGIQVPVNYLTASRRKHGMKNRNEGERYKYFRRQKPIHAVGIV